MKKCRPLSSYPFPPLWNTFPSFYLFTPFFSRVTPTKYHWQRNCWSIQCAWHVSFTSNLLGSCLLFPLLAGNSRRLLAKRKGVLFGGECMTEPTLTQFQQREMDIAVLIPWRARQVTRTRFVTLPVHFVFIFFGQLLAAICSCRWKWLYTSFFKPCPSGPAGRLALLSPAFYSELSAQQHNHQWSWRCNKSTPIDWPPLASSSATTKNNDESSIPMSQYPPIKIRDVPL